MFRWLVLSTIYYHCFKLRNSPECTNSRVKVEEQGIWEWHMVRSFRTTGRCKLPFCNKIWVFGIWVHSPYRDRELTCLCPNVEDFGSWGGRIHQFHAVELTGRLPPVSGCFTPVRWGMEVVSKHHGSFPLPTFGCYSVVGPLYRRGPGSPPELDIRPHDPSWVGIGP